uniref:Uncharacterized protein n=1 Tax=Oryza meridionalis TaxID=40149 RepID=A0A0E0F569_9ORYZ
MEEAVPGVQICASPASWRSDPAASAVGGGGEGGVGGVGSREVGGGADGGGGIGGGPLARAEVKVRLQASPVTSYLWRVAAGCLTDHIIPYDPSKVMVISDHFVCPSQVSHQRCKDLV